MEMPLVENKQQVILGKAIFDSNINKQLINQFKQAVTLRTLNDVQWSILQGDYQKYNWKVLFQNLKSSNAQQIQFDWNYNLKILNQICHINFYQLKILSLSFNNIDNLQAFCWIKSPKLNQLFLSKPYDQKRLQLYMSDKLFKKMFLKLYCQINNKQKGNYQDQNPIKDVSFISLLKFEQQKLQKLALDIQQEDFSYIVGQNINFILKINVSKIQKIWKGNKNRINQQQIMQMVKKKWNQTQILTNQASSSEQQDQEDSEISFQQNQELQ